MGEQLLSKKFSYYLLIIIFTFDLFFFSRNKYSFIVGIYAILQIKVVRQNRKKDLKTGKGAKGLKSLLNSHSLCHMEH